MDFIMEVPYHNITNFNTYDNDTADYYDIINNNVVQAIFLMLYTAIFVLGIFGNVLVCYVVFRNKAMQTVTNLFITNLALSDILLCVLAVPFTPLYTFLERWVFGSVICHLVPFAQGASVYISTLTLTSIAIDRFFVIIYPFHPRMKMLTCILIIVAIWCFSILVTLPYGIYMQHKLDNNTGADRRICEEHWPHEYYRKIFGGLTTTMQFIIPFLLIAFCYICVSLRLQDRAKNKPGSKNSKKEEADRERKRRTNRMLIAMVVIFLISWLPLNVINIVNDFHQEFGNWTYYLISFFMVHSMAMSSTCYNPFLYAWLNENFRKEFKQVLPCFDHHSSSNNRNSNNQGYRGQTNWRQSERTCNGNETLQESLLPSTTMTGSRATSTGVSMKEQQGSAGMLLQQEQKSGDSGCVEVEDVMVPTMGVGAVYDPVAETVKLKLIVEEEPPPYDNAVRADL